MPWLGPGVGLEKLKKSYFWLLIPKFGRFPDFPKYFRSRYPNSHGQGSAKIRLNDKSSKFSPVIFFLFLLFASCGLKQPEFILLDEATSSLDSATERDIQKSLATLCEGKTSIVVAHRSSTIRHADKIVVMNDGGVAECGR